MAAPTPITTPAAVASTATSAAAPEKPSLFKRLTSVVARVVTAPFRSVQETVGSAANTVIHSTASPIASGSISSTAQPSPIAGVTLSPTIAPTIPTNLTIRQANSFYFYRVGENGKLIQVDLGAEQQKLNTLWGQLTTQMIAQARKKFHDWLPAGPLTADDLVEISIDWKTGYAKIIYGTKQNPRNRSENIPRIEEFLFVEDPNSPNNPYQQMWEIFKNQLRVVKDGEQPGKHTGAENGGALLGASIGSGAHPFADHPVMKTTDSKKATVEAFQAEITGADPATLAQKRRKLLMIPDILRRLKENAKARKGVVLTQITPAKTDAAKKKADADQLEVAEATTPPPANLAELRTQHPNARGIAEAAEATLKEAENQLKLIEGFEKHLEDADAFAIAWVMEHSFPDIAALPIEKRVENAEKWMNDQVKELIAYLGYTGFYNWNNNYGKHLYTPGNPEKRKEIELTCKNIVLGGLKDPLLHATIYQKLQIPEPEINIGSAVQHYVEHTAVPAIMSEFTKGMSEENQIAIMEAFTQAKEAFDQPPQSPPASRIASALAKAKGWISQPHS